MKHSILFIIFYSFLICNIDAQSYKVGQKVEGGILFIVNKKSGIVAAENILGLMTWEEGKKACEDLVLNGYDNWRLPTMKELSLFYYEIYIKGLSNLPTGFYWSSKENTGIRELAWCFDFKDTGEYNGHPKSNKKCILPVRTY